MKKTIIEILKDISEGKTPPKKIIFRNKVYEYEEEFKDYYNEEEDYLFDSYCISTIINDEVEILETEVTIYGIKVDNTPKKIEKLKEEHYSSSYEIIDKINEIIDYISKEE